MKTVPISRMANGKINNLFSRYEITAIGPREARMIRRELGRDPTIEELWAFNVEWNEHCGYPSSRQWLRKYFIESGLTSAPNVAQTIGADAGGIFLPPNVQGERYVVTFKIESHNHPSQKMPVEGAATGIGGIIRDQQGEVIAVLDPLRFGDPYGRNASQVRYVANGVIVGIGNGYGNPVGIPNVGGDVVFNQTFDDNCLVNVCAIGLVGQDEITPNKIPKERKEPYKLIVVGKPTDNSGFGGAAFASRILDRTVEDRGAVQVAEPFLKEVLLEAERDVIKRIRERGYHPSEIARKDFGGGGFYCFSSEIGSKDVGTDSELTRIHLSMEGLPPHVISGSETQERYGWAVPESLVEDILRIYNEEWALPEVYEGAKASVVGNDRDDGRYILRYNGEIVCDLPLDFLVGGVEFNKKMTPSKRTFKEPETREPRNFSKVLLTMLNDVNIASRSPVFTTYDSTVKGNTVIGPGEADAGVITHPKIYPIGIAAKADSIPTYGRISPYWGGANAVAEAVRNVAAVGATPQAISDGLNFGDPNKPVVMWQFAESLRGIADALKEIGLKSHDSHLPVISGNVSLYNESKQTGRGVDPSPIIFCVGVLDDVSKAVTMRVKRPGSRLYLVGERHDELGGSEYYRTIHRRLGANVPQIRWAQERGMVYGVIDAINEGLVLAVHDISNGGMLVTIAEMLMGGNIDGRYGAEININAANSDLRRDKILFSESSGYVLEVSQQNASGFERIMRNYGVKPHYIGDTERAPRLVAYGGGVYVNLQLDDMKTAWSTGLKKALR